MLIKVRKYDTTTADRNDTSPTDMYYRLTTDVNSNITETYSEEHTQEDDPIPKEDEPEFKLNDLLKVKIKPHQLYIPTNNILNKTMARRMMSGRR